MLSPIALNSLLAASNYPKLRLPDAALYPLFLFDENDDDDDDDDHDHDDDDDDDDDDHDDDGDDGDDGVYYKLCWEELLIF